MSQGSFNAVSGVMGAIALGALAAACVAVYRTCRRSDLEAVVLVAAIAAGLLVLGMLLGWWLLLPKRSGFLAMLLWVLAMAVGLYVFGARSFECFNT